MADAVSALREVILAGEQYRLRAASHLGLSTSESRAVSYLLARGAVGQTQLAQTLGFNTSSTTALIDRLERLGVAERLADPHDRRRSNVRISEQGLRSLGDVPNWLARAFETIEPADLPELTRMLNAIAESVGALASEDRIGPHGAPDDR